MSANPGDAPNASPIPACIRIGVTGHRDIQNPDRLREAIDRELVDLDDRIRGILKTTPYTFAAVSPLAEGADRLVAEAVLAHRTANQCGEPWLDVVLPMPAEDYRQDFETAASKQAFDQLLGSAASHVVLGERRASRVAYRRAGQYVVDHSDVVIAVIDPDRQAKPAGTAEILKYATDKKRYVISIHPETGHAVRPTPGATGYQKLRATLSNFERCNSENVDDEALARIARQFASDLGTHAESAGLDIAEALDSLDPMLKAYARLDYLAQRHSDRHNLSGRVLYFFAALAILLVGLQIVFLGDQPHSGASIALILGEAFSLALILLFIGLANKGKWLRCWIDYRFLAECLRSLMFMKLAGTGWGVPERPAHMRISDLPDRWMVMAQRCLWENSKVALLPFDDHLARFLKSAWVDDQIQYYRRRASTLLRRDRILARLGFLLFSATLVAALLHLATDVQPWLRVLSYLAIGLPACGTALAGFKALRDFKRLAERYKQVALQLQNMSNVVLEADNREALVDTLNHVREMMHFEHHGWRTVVFFHKLEAG